MNFIAALFHKNIASISILIVVLGVCISCSNTPEIVVQQMKMEIPAGEQMLMEELLPGEIADTKIEHIAYIGPTVQKVQLSDENISMFLFVKGSGSLKADTTLFKVVPESIAIPMTYKSIKIEVEEGEELHFVRFTKKLSEQDIVDLSRFPDDSKYDIYFTNFDDCEPYTEKIKSPNTVSRTVLPEHIIPRVALGTVEAPGPDEVGAHKHAMLDQLFLGLTDNDIVVHADGASAEFTEYSLLHIPIGSSHWVSVDENKRMYYLWMDFFLTKEGQEWLKTHKPISTDKDEY
ncbi:cupin domain-containing protein [uncultured Draconibacterium sp.]|uniref:cupin domain-containing protein n=1 Tax=uncultured Draconibacterium sp. TaxID=1573823 RepID=UPI0029C9493C|nr:cupin domain-containing protein [uncultured Draconibacterium sp.]